MSESVDYVEFIENNQYLLEFFNEFPLRLMELAFDVSELHKIPKIIT